MDFKFSLGKYSKTIVAALAYLGVVGGVLEDGVINGNEPVILISGFLGVIAVYQIRNQK